MLDSLRTAIRDMGAFAAGLYALDRTLTRLTNGRARIYFYRIELQPIPGKPLLPPHRGRQFEIRQIAASDPALAAIPRPRSALDARFEQGSRCFAAFQQERLVGQIWLQLDRYVEDEVRCRFLLNPPDKVAWDYDVYVDPSLRGGFLFAKLWDAAFEFLRERGIQWTASRISAFNSGSLTAHKRLGAREVGRAIFVVIGRWQLTLTTLRPFLHATFSGAAMPVLRIAAPPSST